MPMPPSCAMAIASRASVTVSIAADTKGMFSSMLREKRVAREVSLGRTWENAGTNNMSSKVSALPIRRMSKLQMMDCTHDMDSYPERDRQKRTNDATQCKCVL